jgi:hypothetical protein
MEMNGDPRFARRLKELREGAGLTQQQLGERAAEGYAGFRRYACKMATGGGKTTVMGMLAAWSILNKVNDRSDARFSDVVLIVCPNVTIRDRLQELDPEQGEASLYRTRDLVPPHLMSLLSRGRALVTNWHVFEPQAVQVGDVSARVSRAGVPVRTRETIIASGRNGNPPRCPVNRLSPAGVAGGAHELRRAPAAVAGGGRPVPGGAGPAGGRPGQHLARLGERPGLSRPAGRPAAG